MFGTISGGLKRKVSMAAAATLLVSILGGVTSGRQVSASQMPEGPRNNGGKVTWDCVYFGKYPQSDANGNSKEAIKWRVLSVDNGEALLQADSNLDVYHYYDALEDITWEDSLIRCWLNAGVIRNSGRYADYRNTGFLAAAFSAAEKDAIADTQVVNCDNPQQPDVSGGNNTTDKIFLLSYVEATNPSYGFSSSGEGSDKARIRKNTAYVAAGGKMESSHTAAAGQPGIWWLRSPGVTEANANIVLEDGKINPDGTVVYSEKIAVCPALRLKLSANGVWTYAGTVGSDGSSTPGEAPPDSGNVQATTGQATTAQPVTERQATTAQPVTERPTTERATTAQPVTERPTTAQPATQQEATTQPVTERQATTEWKTEQQPVAEWPTTQQLTEDQQVTTESGWILPGSEQEGNSGAQQDTSGQLLPSEDGQTAETGTGGTTEFFQVPEVVPVPENLLPKAGTKKTISGCVYQVKSSTAKKRTVSLIRVTNKKKKKITVPAAVTIEGFSYKVMGIQAKAFRNHKKLNSVIIGKNVTSIGKEAFSGCKKLKRITIKGTSLKSVGSKALKGISKNAVVKVPKKKWKAYKKLFQKKTGFQKSMKVKA